MKKAILVLAAVLISKSACAFDPVTIGLASWFTTSIGMPVSYALGCAFAYSPGIRIFGTERAVYGLDWGSLACHAENVYGMQMSFVGGSVEECLYGLQLGILASGYAQEELPFDEYHFFNIDHCWALRGTTDIVATDRVIVAFGLARGQFQRHFGSDQSVWRDGVAGQSKCNYR